MTGMIRRLVRAGFAALAARAACADDGPPVMDPDPAARLMETCDAELAPRLERDVFAYADRPGTRSGRSAAWSDGQLLSVLSLTQFPVSGSRR